ncbi:MAG: N-acetylmuramoyl-L-alanine amidase [Desulfocapsaceae bacterium]|nr:N-acetylmuramoyl-L-alanine amidase [Desulfocapsaceae bacterium]
MRRFIVISLLIILGLLQFTTQPLFCNERVEGREAPDNSIAEGKTSHQRGDLAKSFKQATSYFTELKKDKERVGSKEEWDTASKNFQKIHDRQPKSAYAAASLFMLGRITYSRYLQFRDVADLDKSLKYYQDVTTLFPWHQLADDSLFTQGRIQLEDKKDPQEAARIYARITSEYYTGELMSKATEKLEILARDFNIPLPPAVTAVVAEGSQPSAGSSPAVDVSELPNVKNRSYVLPVKYWSSNNYTRIVINTSRPVSYKEELLEKVGEQPRRLFIDFDKSYIEPQYRAPIPIQDGLLQQVRTAQFSPDTVRVVLDIESIKSYKIYSLPDPFRVIVDVHGQSNSADVAVVDKLTPPEKQGKDDIVSLEPGIVKERPRANLDTTDDQNAPILILQDYKKNKLSAKPKEPAPELNAPLTSPALSLAQQLNLGVRRIVLDPGHGGKDPGASAFGLKEKDLVLQVAKKLAAKLKKEMGYEVILTRNDDTFISLEERTAIANTNGADLFISLHLNAHPSAKVYGFETYYLNLSTDSEAIRVAALENATSTHQLSDLQTILSDIMKNSKIDESSRLAEKVQGALSSGLTGRKYRQVKSLGVKQAPFYVLIGAEMPAILIEMAFLSNKTDAHQVKKGGYQDALAAEIVHGLQKYIRTITASL